MKASKPAAKPLPRLPHPAKNLGGHLKAPASGEIVTSHRWVDRKAKG